LDKDHALKHLILTGHKDGQVLIWRLSQYIGVIDDYKCEVTAMSFCFEGVAFATIDGKIYIWDIYLLKNNKIIDINLLPFKILSEHIVSLDFNKRKLIILTMNGDVIETKLNEQTANQTIKAQRIN